MRDVAFYLKRPKADEPTAIFARICYTGVKCKYYIDKSIHPQYWNKETHRARQTTKFPRHPEFNKGLDKIRDTIIAVYDKYLTDNQGKQPAEEQLKNLIDIALNKNLDQAPFTFLTFFKDIIDRSKDGTRLNYKTKKRIEESTIKTYTNVYNALLEYKRKTKRYIDFETITISFYNNYTSYLAKELKFSINTIGKHIAKIKMVMGEALEQRLTNNIDFKSKRFLVISEDVDAVYLNKDELKVLYELDLTANARLDRVRDSFLLGCYTGLRFSDVAKLDPNNTLGNKLKVKQKKTGKDVFIGFDDLILEMIKKYNGKFPEQISNQKMNDYLKDLTKGVDAMQVPFTIKFTKGGEYKEETYPKWELISTHTMRRSFATNEYLAGTPVITIMSRTGHKTETSFLKYIKVTPEQHAELIRQQQAKRQN